MYSFLLKRGNFGHINVLNGFGLGTMGGVKQILSVFRVNKFHQEVGRSSQYVCLLTFPNPKPLLKHDMTKVSTLLTKMNTFEKNIFTFMLFFKMSLNYLHKNIAENSQFFFSVKM